MLKNNLIDHEALLDLANPRNFDYTQRMTDLLTTTTEVIDALGGNQPVQELTAARWPQTVSNWRSFETFPSHTYVVRSEELV